MSDSFAMMGEKESRLGRCEWWFSESYNESAVKESLSLCTARKKYDSRNLTVTVQELICMISPITLARVMQDLRLFRSNPLSTQSNPSRFIAFVHRSLFRSPILRKKS